MPRLLFASASGEVHRFSISRNLVLLYTIHPTSRSAYFIEFNRPGFLGLIEKCLLNVDAIRVGSIYLGEEDSTALAKELLAVYESMEKLLE